MSTREYRELVRDSILAFLHSRRNLALNTRTLFSIQTHLGFNEVPAGEQAIAASTQIQRVIHQLYHAGTIFITRYEPVPGIYAYGWTLI